MLGFIKLRKLKLKFNHEFGGLTSVDLKVKTKAGAGRNDGDTPL
jgi:hypothetical protein